MERKPLDDADLAQWTVRRPADPACAAGDGRARKASVTGTGRKWDSGRADHGGDQVRRRHSWSSMRHVVTQQPQIACWNSSQARQISGPGRSTQVARRSLDAALKRDERRIAFRMRCSRSKQATTGPDHAARQHEIVVQREGFNGHAVGILAFAGRAHAQSATAEGGDAIEEWPVIIAIGKDGSAKRAHEAHLIGGSDMGWSWIGSAGGARLAIIGLPGIVPGT